MKRAQTSSNASPISIKSHRSSSVSSVSLPIGPLPLSYNPDTLARSLKFHHLQNQQDELQRKSSIGITRTTDSLVAVDYPLHAALHAFGQLEASATHKAPQLPKPPPEPLDALISSKARKMRPKSLPYMPRYAGRSMVLTATPDPVKRESVHVLSQQVLDAYKPSLPAIDSYSPLNSDIAESSTSALPNTIYFSDISKSTDATPPKHSYTSSLDYPASPISPAVLKAGPNKVRPKTWNPRNLVNAIKARNEAQGKLMGRNNFQATKVMMDAAQYERGRIALNKSFISPHEAAARSRERTVDGLNATGGSRRKTTAFEDFVALDDGQAQAQNGNVKPVEGIPVIIQPGDRRPGAGDWAQNSSDEEESRDSLIRRLSRRVSRRRTTGEREDQEKVQAAMEELKEAVKREGRRGQQLAMRQTALEAAKTMKSDRKDWEQLPSQRRSPVTSAPPKEINSDPLRSHPPEETPLKQLQENPPKLSVQEPTPRSSLPTQSPPQIDPVLPPSPPEEQLLDFALDFSPSAPKPSPHHEREHKFQSFPKRLFCQPQSQQSETSSVPHASPTPPPILRTQTEPIPPKAPRNDLETLPSQKIAAIRNYTPPSRSFTQPLKHGKTELLQQERLHSRSFADRPKSLFNPASAPSEQKDEIPESHPSSENDKRDPLSSTPTKQIDEPPKKERRKSLFGSSSADAEKDARPLSGHKEKRKSGFGSTDISQSKSSERPKTADSSKRRSFFGSGGDKTLSPSTTHSQSPELLRGQPHPERKGSDGTQVSVASMKKSSRRQSWARPYMETDTGKEVAVEGRPASRGSVKSVRTVIGVSEAPKVPAFELDHMTPESIDLLRGQEKLLRRMTATSSVVNVSIAPGIEVPFGVAVGRIGAATVPATPGRETPAVEETPERGDRKSLNGAAYKGRAKQSRFVETGSIFREMGRRRRDSETVRRDGPDGEDDGLRVQRRRDRLEVERLGAGRRAVTMLDLTEKAHVVEKKKSRWKFWKKV